MPVDDYNKEHYRRNEERLAALRDIHKGRRAFLIGNGPSLTMEDLTTLHAHDEITLASNKIWLAFERTPWRPTYYTMCDEVVARTNREKIMALELDKVLAHSVRKYLWEDPRAIFLNPKRSRDDQSDVEGWDLVRGANAGRSVLNVDIKIAWWMGVREMYVIGCDHNFVVPETRTGEQIMHNEVIVAQGEVNHFDPNYRPRGEEWTVPQLDLIEQDFAESRRIVESTGGTIQNASRFTKLEVWDRVDFDSLF